MGTACVWYLRKSQERTGSPEIEITDECALPEDLGLIPSTHMVRNNHP